MEFVTDGPIRDVLSKCINNAVEDLKLLGGFVASGVDPHVDAKPFHQNLLLLNLERRYSTQVYPNETLGQMLLRVNRHIQQGNNCNSVMLPDVSGEDGSQELPPASAKKSKFGLHMLPQTDTVTVADSIQAPTTKYVATNSKIIVCPNKHSVSGISHPLHQARFKVDCGVPPSSKTASVVKDRSQRAAKGRGRGRANGSPIKPKQILSPGKKKAAVAAAAATTTSDRVKTPPVKCATGEQGL